MKRITGYFLAALLLLGAASASAQTAVWTGDYYVVLGMNEKLEYTAAYGYHAKWFDLKAGPNFEGGTLADLVLAPTTVFTGSVMSRYEMLAVGTRGGQAYTVAGYEWINAPEFTDGMEPIADLISATAVSWTGSYYVVLGRAMGGDGVLPTPRDVVAYGRPGAWQLTYLPFNDALTFTHLAAVPVPPVVLGNQEHRAGAAPPSYPPYELLAVGRYTDGSAFTMSGYVADGEAHFYNTTLPIPKIMRPIAVEWSGRDYVIVGDRGNGQFGVMYGAPGRWTGADDFTLDGGRFTAMTIAPNTATLPTTPVGYDLLAVGTLHGMAVSLPGREVNGVPVFDHGCAMILDMRGTADGPSPGPAFAVGVDGASTLSAPYPNPFGQRATFTVTVGEEQRVRVAAFDALGREVAVLHDGALTVGPAHAFALDGAALPSGTYVIRAQGTSFVQARTVVLTR